jgi:hypothetical protein
MELNQMARDKTPNSTPEPRDPLPAAPPPSGTNPSEGMILAQAMARQFMPNSVQLWAAVAFSENSPASIWTKVQCARMLALTAGAFPEATPMAPQPLDGGSDGRVNHHD